MGQYYFDALQVLGASNIVASVPNSQKNMSLLPTITLVHILLQHCVLQKYYQMEPQFELDFFQIRRKRVRPLKMGRSSTHEFYFCDLLLLGDSNTFVLVPKAQTNISLPPTITFVHTLLQHRVLQKWQQFTLDYVKYIDIQ